MTSEPRRPVYPPVYFAVAVLLILVIRFAVPGPLWPAPPWNYVFGLSLVAFAILMAITGRVTFSKRGTTIKPFETSTVLVTTGLYRWSRNPMYVGMVAGLVGIAILVRAPAALLVAPLFAWWIAARFIAREERDLEARFGDDYRAYLGRVRRWL